MTNYNSDTGEFETIKSRHCVRPTSHRNASYNRIVFFQRLALLFSVFNIAFYAFAAGLAIYALALHDFSNINAVGALGFLSGVAFAVEIALKRRVCPSRKHGKHAMGIAILAVHTACAEAARAARLTPQVDYSLAG